MSRCLSCKNYTELSEPIVSRSLTYTGLCREPTRILMGQATLCASSIGFASMCRFYEPKVETKEEAA